jgi:hypothetical protein
MSSGKLPVRPACQMFRLVSRVRENRKAGMLPDRSLPPVEKRTWTTLSRPQKGMGEMQKKI